MAGREGEEGNDDADECIKGVADGLKRSMLKLEPQRWEKESLPPDKEFLKVAEYAVRHHLGSLLRLQGTMFGDVDPHSEETLIKAYKCTQRQNEIMEKFGAFSGNEAMRRAFESSRLKREAMTKGL
uniref:Uncharacterized protein n=1 Tax=Trieres chinensis TaxID=1514140 RepID=A0A7S1ZV50_TRICV|mmetsp:Transcript_33586/g.68577  ORF Transcript_33586/g.68577 Transcript_33586/m.68577 type:complete len:126 (+) Transcript_33586:1-378(+)